MFFWCPDTYYVLLGHKFWASPHLPRDAILMDFLVDEELCQWCIGALRYYGKVWRGLLENKARGLALSLSLSFPPSPPLLFMTYLDK